MQTYSSSSILTWRQGAKVAALLLAGTATAAWAAPAPADQPAETLSAADTGEIVVTAQRREERLQDVPISITALATRDLDTRNVNGIDRLDNYVPNLKIATGTYSTEATIAIRGGVEISTTPYYDPAVGLYVDGVYIAKSQGNTFDLADLERIEVLRGPQGTLYGRNTFAGAINLITAKPTGEFGGNFKAGIGNYGEQRIRFNLNLPRIGDFAIKLAGLYNRRAGYWKYRPNPFPNVANAQPGARKRAEALNNKAFRAAVRYDRGGPLTVDYAFEYNALDATSRAPRLDSVATDPLAGALFDPASPSYVGALVGGIYLGLPADLYLQPGYSNFTYGNGAVRNDRPEERSRVYGNTLTLTLDVGDATLKSLSSLRNMDFIHSVDLDGTPLALAAVYLHNDYIQYSQEFQITGSAGIFNYTAGLYYFHEKGDVDGLQQYFGNTTTSDSDYIFKTDAYAAYAQVDAQVTEQLTLTGGLRYSYERKSIAATLGSLNETTQVLTPIYGLTRGKRGDGALTPTAIIKYAFSRDANVYLKYARGFKSGGFNLGTNLAFAVTRYDPQFVSSYEAGTKLRLAGGAVQINGAVFLNKISDQQVTVFRNNGVLATSVVDNAAEGKVYGAEGDIRIVPSEWLKLTGSLGYLHAEYQNYIDAGVDVSKTRASIFAPKWTIAGSAEITLMKTDVGTLAATIDYSYASSHYVQAFDLRPRSATVRSSAQTTRAAPLKLVDLGLRLSDVPVGSSTIELSAWMKNAFNTHRRVGGIDFGASFGNLTTAFYNRPRTYGLDATLRF